MRSTRVAFVVLVLFGLSACALTDETVTINYQPQDNTEKIGSAAGVSVAVRSIDARLSDRTKISAKINGYGTELGAYKADREVTVIVKEAVEKELETRGYNVAKGSAVIEVAIKRFYTQFESGFIPTATSQVIFDVQIKNKTEKTLYEQQFRSSAKNDIWVIASGVHVRETLERALVAAIGDMFDDKALRSALAGAGAI